MMMMIKDKMKQSRERSSALPQHLSVVAIEKGALWLLLIKVANFTFLLLYQVQMQLVLTID